MTGAKRGRLRMMGEPWKRVVAIVSLLLLFPLQLCAQQQQWRPVGGGILMGISGMALVEPRTGARTTFLVVHDNKQRGEGRVGLVEIEGLKPPRYTPLAWPTGELPEDLEALARVPAVAANSFMALASAGKIYHLLLDSSHSSIKLLKVFRLPDAPKESNFEGFTLYRMGERLLAVWAHRGEGADPAVIYWARLDPVTYSFSGVRSARLTVPWPKTDVRHVSDLKIDDGGALFITSASDPGDDGPFASALYLAGSFDVCEGQVVFRQTVALVRLLRFDYHKVEAFELVPGMTGGLAFATDDEHMGSSIYLDW